MARPLREDYPGATHHVFVRGVARSAIALDDEDYQHALYLLERGVSRFEFRCHAWCYLPNHTHLLVTSQLGNLSRAMHWLGTCTAQSFNRRYERSGHVYQGRFGSKLVDSDEYLLELARYIPLNPVRAAICGAPGEWPWSSYAATAGLRSRPWFLEVEHLLGMLGSVPAYVDWVAGGEAAAFLDEIGHPRAPSRPSLGMLLAKDSNAGLALAYEHGYSQTSIARHLGVSQAQISRRLAAHR